MTATFPGRLAVLQRILPDYRRPFFELLDKSCEGGLRVLAGQPRPEESISTVDVPPSDLFIKLQNRHFLGPHSPFYFCWQDGITSWLERWQPDALIVEANPRYLSTPAAVRWMKRRQRPVLGWGLGAPEIGGLLGGWWEHSRLRFLKTLDGVIAYSRRGAEEYRRLGLAPERVFVAPNAAAARPRHSLPERSMKNNTLTILFVGRLQERKRLDVLLQACSELSAGLQPRVWIVGDGPARQKVEALAEKIYPRAEFFGAQHGADLANLFREADLFVLPGTGGLAVQEAMSYGLPVVVARGDGTQDDLVRPPSIAGERANGWQVQPDDLQALMATLIDALASPERLRQMGRESYRIVSEEINLEQMVTRFIEALAVVAKSIPVP